MITPATIIPDYKNTCATCAHCMTSNPASRPWSDVPQSTYTCALTGRKVSPCLRPCLLYQGPPTPRFPTPTRPNPHPLPA